MEDSADRARQPLPFRRLDLKLAASFGRQPVKLRPPVVLRNAILRGDPSPFDQTVQGRVERALFHLQYLIAVPLDCLDDRVAVNGPEEQRAQNQQIERAL